MRYKDPSGGGAAGADGPGRGGDLPSSLRLGPVLETPSGSDLGESGKPLTRVAASPGRRPLPADRSSPPSNLGIRVTDLSRSLPFATRTLGMKVVRRGDTRSWGGGKWVLLQDPRTRRLLELNWYRKGSLFFSPYRAGDALDHLDFTIGVASRESLERTYRRLLRLGARPTRWRRSTTQGWMASVTDPDGIWITIGRRPTPAERRAMR
ncbi:MAG: VOC family protein [Thermoplasmata archaeon]